jgi:hypothetical protein
MDSGYRSDRRGFLGRRRVVFDELGRILHDRPKPAIAGKQIESGNVRGLASARETLPKSDPILLPQIPSGWRLRQ